MKAHDIPVPASVDKADELIEYAVQPRYPGEGEPVSKDEARRALVLATLVLAAQGLAAQGLATLVLAWAES